MGMAALLLSFGLILAGCGSPADPAPDPGMDGAPARSGTVDAGRAKNALSDQFAGFRGLAGCGKVQAPQGNRNGQ
jgi:hypothetical protein